MLLLLVLVMLGHGRLPVLMVVDHYTESPKWNGACRDDSGMPMVKSHWCRGGCLVVLVLAS